MSLKLLARHVPAPHFYHLHRLYEWLTITNPLYKITHAALTAVYAAAMWVFRSHIVRVYKMRPSSCFYHTILVSSWKHTVWKRSDRKRKGEDGFCKICVECVFPADCVYNGNASSGAVRSSFCPSIRLLLELIPFHPATEWCSRAAGDRGTTHLSRTPFAALDLCRPPLRRLFDGVGGGGGGDRCDLADSEDVSNIAYVYTRSLSHMPTLVGIWLSVFVMFTRLPISLWSKGTPYYSRGLAFISLDVTRPCVRHFIDDQRRLNEV